MTTEAVCGGLPSIWTSGAANKAPPANTNDTGMIAKARVWTPRVTNHEDRKEWKPV